MPDIALHPSKIDDSWHAIREGTVIASGAYKAVLSDATLALGPGERIVRGGHLAMKHPPTPAATAKALASTPGAKKGGKTKAGAKASAKAGAKKGRKRSKSKATAADSPTPPPGTSDAASGDEGTSGR